MPFFASGDSQHGNSSLPDLWLFTGAPGHHPGKALSCYYQGKRYWFCCTGCLQLFENDPEALLQETAGLVVCPVCLAEKPVAATVQHECNGAMYHFCRCPHCLVVFKRDPDTFINRLAWQTDYAGIFGDLGECCAKN